MNKTITNFLDIRGDNKLVNFLEFRESKTFSEIESRLEAVIKVQTNEVFVEQADNLRIDYKNVKDGYMTIKTSQFLRYLIGQNLSMLVNSEFWKKRSSKFNKVYFSENKLLKNHLIYYIALSLINIEIRLYILDNDLIRVCNREQYRKSLIVDKEKYWTIQLWFNNIAHYTFYWKRCEEIIEREYHLSIWEEKIIRELRLPKYTQKNVKIDIRWDWTLRSMTIKWIEENLDEYWKLKNTISPDWFIALDKALWTPTKIIIEERFSLDKPTQKK